MDKAELGTIIRETSKKETEARCQEVKNLLDAAHKRAGGLATQLLDHYEVEPWLYERGAKTAFYRLTPYIPIGEIASDDVDGSKHGFVKVNTRLQAEGTIVRKGKVAMLIKGPLAEPVEIVNPQPTDIITNVGILLFTGDPDCTNLAQGEEVFRTSSAYLRHPSSINLAQTEMELTELLNHRTKAVDILELLVSEVIGTDTPATS